MLFVTSRSTKKDPLTANHKSRTITIIIKLKCFIIHNSLLIHCNPNLSFTVFFILHLVQQAFQLFYILSVKNGCAGHQGTS